MSIDPEELRKDGYLRLRIVETQNPPVKGVWLYARDWDAVETLDAAIHRWSMKQHYKRAGQ